MPTAAALRLGEQRMLWPEAPHFTTVYMPGPRLAGVVCRWNSRCSLPGMNELSLLILAATALAVPDPPAAEDFFDPPEDTRARRGSSELTTAAAADGGPDSGSDICFISWRS
jgi:hypothetical protein